MRTLTVLVAVGAVLALASSASAADRAYSILPPGNYGGITLNSHSLDQLPLYDSLTPLTDHIGPGTIASHYKPEGLGAPAGGTIEAVPGHPGITLRRDAYGVPHITGKTQDDLFYGAGYVNGEDRSLLLSLAKGAARAAVADVPGLDAFGLVTSGKTFTPSAQSERLLASEQQQIIKAYGARGRSMLHAFSVYAQGVTAGSAGTSTPVHWTANDVIAADAFIGSIFGNGGGSEVANSRFLALLRSRLGAKKGIAAWRDLMEANDPEAPVTTTKRFNYGTPGIGPDRSSLLVDANSVSPIASFSSVHRMASNFQVLSGSRSTTHRPLFVAGPQLGYYYPEIVEEADLKGPGIAARGAFPPGGGPFVLIGRTRDYSWSLTTAQNDNTDTFLMPLCRDRTHYVYRGKCRAMTTFDAGSLDGKEVVFKRTVHGPVAGYVRSHGKRYAIAKQRSTYGQDGNSIMALRDMTLGRGKTVNGFFSSANEFGFTFNWAYSSRKHIAYFSAGKLPHRAKGVDPLLPTLGSGKYDWKGFLSLKQHPHVSDPKSGVFLNWNNKPAPGWTQGDNVHGYGSVHRVELFHGYGKRTTLEHAVGVMNRAATQDIRIEEVWPVIRSVLRGHSAPDLLTRQAIALLDAWRRHGGNRLDRDLDGKIDDPGAAVMDHAWGRLANAVMRPQLGGTLLDELGKIETPDSPPYRDGGNGSSFGDGWYEYVDKDLRTLLNPRKVRGKFHLRYCGRGNIGRCRTALFAAIQGAAAELSAQQGSDPSKWRSDATLDRISFKPGLIPNTMRWTNRPTFQQVISWGAAP